MSPMPTNPVPLGHDEQQKHDAAGESSFTTHRDSHVADGVFYTLEDVRDHATWMETWHMSNEHSSPESAGFPIIQEFFSSDPLAVSVVDLPPWEIISREPTQHCCEWEDLTGDANLHAQFATPVDCRVLMSLDGTTTNQEHNRGASTTLAPCVSGDDCRESEPSTRPTRRFSLAASEMSGARSLVGTTQAKKHNMAEKKYRAGIKDSFQLLRDSLPDLNEGLCNIRGERIVDDWQRQCSFYTGGRLNKASILRAAAEYIQLLENQNQSLRDRLSDYSGRGGASVTESCGYVL